MYDSPKKVINKIWNFSGIDIFLSAYVGGGGCF